jgi:hypothetical protein
MPCAGCSPRQPHQYNQLPKVGVIYPQDGVAEHRVAGRPAGSGLFYEPEALKRCIVLSPRPLQPEAERYSFGGSIKTARNRTGGSTMKSNYANRGDLRD